MRCRRRAGSALDKGQPPPPPGQRRPRGHPRGRHQWLRRSCLGDLSRGLRSKNDSQGLEVAAIVGRHLPPDYGRSPVGQRSMSRRTTVAAPAGLRSHGAELPPDSCEQLLAPPPPAGLRSWNTAIFHWASADLPPDYGALPPDSCEQLVPGGTLGARGARDRHKHPAAAALCGQSKCGKMLAGRSRDTTPPDPIGRGCGGA